MDIDKAEEMFRKVFSTVKMPCLSKAQRANFDVTISHLQYIKWRVENDIDNALTWDVAPDLKEHFRYKLTGLSHNGGLGKKLVNNPSVSKFSKYEANFDKTKVLGAKLD